MNNENNNPKNVMKVCTKCGAVYYGESTVCHCGGELKIDTDQQIQKQTTNTQTRKLCPQCGATYNGTREYCECGAKLIIASNTSAAVPKIYKNIDLDNRLELMAKILLIGGIVISCIAFISGLIDVIENIDFLFSSGYSEYGSLFHSIAISGLTTMIYSVIGGFISVLFNYIIKIIIDIHKSVTQINMK